MIDIIRGLLLILFLDSVVIGQDQSERRTSALVVAQYNCEGKDSNNYTLISQHTDGPDCSLENQGHLVADKIIALARNGQKVANELQLLALSSNYAGVNRIIDRLSLVVSGPGSLEGKFIFERRVIKDERYLKRCSSVLGQSILKFEQLILLISDKLDENVLISLTGGFTAFQKIATTTCQGMGYLT